MAQPPENQEQETRVDPTFERRRLGDAQLSALYRFVLSLAVVFGCFTYLYIARPNDVVTATVLGFVGAVITFWFLRRPTSE